MVLIRGGSWGSLADMVAAKGNKEIGGRSNKIINRLADANDSPKGTINAADFNDDEKLGKGEEMMGWLSKLWPASKDWISAVIALRATTC